MLNHYVFAYTIYALVVYFIAIISCKVRIKMNQVIIVLIVLSFISSVIAALRPINTQDTLIYNKVYENSLYIVTGLSAKDKIFFNRFYYNIEMFYIIIMSLFRYFLKSPVIFYLIQGILSNLLMMYGLYELCEYSFELNSSEKQKKFIGENLLQIYSFYVLFCGVLYTSSAIRDGLSISIGMIAIGNLLLKKKKGVSILLLIISVLIHSTSLVFIPIYFLLRFWKLHLSRNCIIILCSLIPILYFAKIGMYGVNFVISFVTKLLQIFNIQAFYSYINNLSFQLPMREGYLLIFTSLFLVFTCYKSKNIYLDKFMIVVIIGLYMFVFAYFIPALARLLYIFILFIVPILMRDARYNKMLQYLSLVYFIPQYVYVFGYLQA